MITIKKKDIIVAMLIASNESLTDLYVSDLKDHDITSDECDMILRQIEKMQFIDIKHRFSRPSGFSSRGAFKAQELILSTQLERLDIEIQLMKSQLTPDKLDQFSKVFSIFSSVCSILPYIKIAHGE